MIVYGNVCIRSLSFMLLSAITVGSDCLPDSLNTGVLFINSKDSNTILKSVLSYSYSGG